MFTRQPLLLYLSQWHTATLYATTQGVQVFLTNRVVYKFNYIIQKAVEIFEYFGRRGFQQW